MIHLFQKNIRLLRARPRQPGRRMGRFMSVSLAGILLSPLLLTGCATTSSALWESSGRPQISIAGAEVQDVRSIAMGSARSKGWRIAEATDDRLILERPMDTDSPQAVAAGISGPAPTIRVTTYFAQHSDDVNVGLDARLVGIANAKGQTTTTDYTETYRTALERSLESLRNTYASHRHRVMTSTPPISETTEIAEMDDGESTPPSETTAAAATPGTPTGPGSSVAVTLPSGEHAWRNESGEIPNWDDSARPDGSAPTPGATSDITGATPLTEAPAQVDPKDNMLVLNTNTATGTWAYYAEQYARLRGCEIGDSGAVLQEKNADYEVHRIACANGQSFLLRCDDGVCRGLE